MSIGTFGSFTQARLAIYAAQNGMQVTGNNISNINTVGYTRQRLDQESLFVGGADRYSSKYDLRIGQGVLSTGVSQLRDPYLDIRYRDETARMGQMEEKLKTLNKIAMILDETGKGVKNEGEDFGLIAADLADMESALRALTTETGHQEWDNQVRAAAVSLCAKLNSYAARLQADYDAKVKETEEKVSEINSWLTSIRDLNESIRNFEIHGQDALELRDTRNVLIDKLAKEMHIDVSYVFEDVGGGEQVSKLIIKLAGDNPDSSVTSDSAELINGIYGSQISIEQVPQARPVDREDKTSWPYQDINGNPVMSRDEAAREPVKNPKFDANAADGPNSLQYLDKNGVPTGDITKAATKPVANANGLLYLKPDGTATNDPEEAKQVNNPNFNLKVSELRDSREKLMFYTDKKVTSCTPAEYSLALKGDPNATPPVPAAGLVQESPRDPNTGVYTITVYQKSAKGEFTKTVYTKTPSKETPLDDNDLTGALQSMREMLTEAGEFTDREIVLGENNNPNDPYRNADETALTKRGIPYYQKSLDLLANRLAAVLNEANKGFMMDSNGNYIQKGTDKDGNEIGIPISIDYQTTDGKGNPITAQYTFKHGTDWDDPDVWDDLPQEVKDELAKISTEPGTETVKEYLKHNGGIEKGGNLFSNNGDSNDDTDITASNISVSYDWSKGPLIVNSFVADQGKTEAASGDSENILHLMGLFTTKRDFYPDSIPSTTGKANHDIMFNGTFKEMWNNVGFTLGQDQQVTGTLLETHEENALQIDTARDSVSAVDFNDEAMNLMMYSKSYNAACRLMTTIDSMLDKLINGTGMTT